MRRLIAIAIAFTTALFAATVPALAARPDTVELCHVDEGTGTATLLTLPATAAQNHIDNHAEDGHPIDGCETFLPADVLVRATTHDPVTGGSTLVAELVDTNGSGHVDAGDTVRAARFPLDLDATALGAFGVTEHVVGEVRPSAGREVSVLTTDNAALWWFSGPEREVYAEALSAAHNSVLLDDWFTSASHDEIWVGPVSETEPAGAFNVTVDRPGDQPFVDVLWSPLLD